MYLETLKQLIHLAEVFKLSDYLVYKLSIIIYNKKNEFLSYDDCLSLIFEILESKIDQFYYADDLLKYIHGAFRNRVRESNHTPENFETTLNYNLPKKDDTNTI